MFYGNFHLLELQSSYREPSELRQDLAGGLEALPQSVSSSPSPEARLHGRTELAALNTLPSIGPGGPDVPFFRPGKQITHPHAHGPGVSMPRPTLDTPPDAPPPSLSYAPIPGSLSPCPPPGSEPSFAPLSRSCLCECPPPKSKSSCLIVVTLKFLFIYIFCIRVLLTCNLH